ncbi:MAG: FkbM family methyltransferase [Actinomycetota bacterium]
MLHLASSPIAPVLGQRVPLRGPSRALFRSYAKTPCLPGQLVRTLTTKFGDDFEVDLSSFLEWQLWAFGAFEEHLAELFGYLVRPGDRCIDVGANVGVHSTRLAKLAGPGGEVIAIEPNPEVAARASRNFALNRLANVRLVRSAASDQAGGSITLYRAGAEKKNRAQSSVLPLSYLTGTATQVPVTRVDDLVSGPVALMKIDVEGHEEAVVAGAAATIEAHSPAIVFEYAPELQPGTGGSPFGWLQAEGYDMYRVSNARNRITGRSNLQLTVLPGLPAIGGDILAIAPAMTPRVGTLITG